MIFEASGVYTLQQQERFSMLSVLGLVDGGLQRVAVKCLGRAAAAGMRVAVSDGAVVHCDSVSLGDRWL